MICMSCSKNCKEKEIECSHNVPIYLFEGNTRNKRKDQADKLGRKNLCVECHNNYEAKILQLMYLNLLNRDIILIKDRKERMPYFREIKNLPQEKKNIGIKICLKINGVENDNS